MRLSVIARTVPVMLLGLAPLACGESNPDPNDPSQFGAQGQYGPGQFNPQAQYQQPGAYPQQPGAYPQPGYQQPGAYPQQPGAYPQQPAPAPTAAPPAAAGGQATAVAPAAGAALTPVMQGLAAAEAPGMQPDGSAFAAQFQEGQTFEQQFNLQGGKCYAVVGVGMGVQQLDLQIVFQMAPAPPFVLAQSQGSGPQATVGGKAQGCFKNPTPISAPAKVVMKATKGAGIGVAQIFVK